MVATGITDEPSTARWMVETILADTSHAGWGEVRRVPVPGVEPSETELSQSPARARCTCTGDQPPRIAWQSLFPAYPAGVAAAR